jgi:hypothetical protein
MSRLRDPARSFPTWCVPARAGADRHRCQRHAVRSVHGTLAQGEFTDRFGRKTAHQFNLPRWLATIVAAFSPNYIWLAALPSSPASVSAPSNRCVSYAGEYAPKNIRGLHCRRAMIMAPGHGRFHLFALGFRDTLGWRGI